jgi:hypothetical protein
VTEIDKDSPEFKQAVADAIAAEVEGLKAKNAELIAKNKKLQAGATITPDDLAAVESDREEWKSKFLAAEKAAKKLTTDLEVATKKAADIDSAYSRSVADAALTEALSKAGVTPALLKAAKALHGSALQVVDDNGARTVKAGDKALSDFITEWASTDEGKHFVAAADTQGGGSHGGRGAHHQPIKGNAGGTREEAIARAEQLLKQHASEE